MDPLTYSLLGVVKFAETSFEYIRAKVVEPLLVEYFGAGEPVSKQKPYQPMLGFELIAEEQISDSEAIWALVTDTLSRTNQCPFDSTKSDFLFVTETLDKADDRVQKLLEALRDLSENPDNEMVRAKVHDILIEGAL